MGQLHDEGGVHHPEIDGRGPRPVQLHQGETGRELGRQQALGIRLVQPDPSVVPIRRADAEADENSGYRSGPAEACGQVRLAQEVEPEVVFDLVGDDEVLLAGEPEAVLSDRPDALGGVALFCISRRQPRSC
ncbi:hypothetical protein [Streptomyces sp. NBC_00076]|uniref:hypothetical protein n=1 Tax=Streptomyces sp. NBC_00076 TaxID=2975642 RepID=UPI00324E34FE